jgi:hypothetical protein
MRRQFFAVTCLLNVSVFLLAGHDVYAAPACSTSLPRNIDAGILAPELTALLQRSPTFQRQCARIASVAVLRVRIGISRRIDGRARAQTIIDRYESGAVRADVSLVFADDYVELIAHEFEHILEQVEGVRLRDEIKLHRAWLTGTGAYETQRAFDAGVRVRQECDALAAEAIEVERRKIPAIRQPIQ